MIVVKNNFCRQLVIDEESGLPQTTKENGQGHGFGLVSVRKVAQKYFGEIDIRQEDTEFLLNIMFLLQQKRVTSQHSAVETGEKNRTIK